MTKKVCKFCGSSGIVLEIGDESYHGCAASMVWMRGQYPTIEAQEAAQVSYYYCSCEAGDQAYIDALNVHTPRPILFESVVLLKVALNNVESIGVYPSDELRVEVEQMKQSLKLLHRKFNMEWEKQ